MIDLISNVSAMYALNHANVMVIELLYSMYMTIVWWCEIWYVVYEIWYM